MELLEGIKTRRSRRAFKPIPVPDGTLKNILQAAGNSASYQNTQPWEVAVLTSAEKIAELGKIIFNLTESGIPPNPDFIRPALENWPPELAKRSVEHGIERLRATGVDRADTQKRKELNMRGYSFFGAPCVLFLFTDSTLGPWSIFDMGLFAQNIILAAHSFGLGCCPQASMVNYPDAVRQFLGIPKTKRLMVPISIGYPDLEDKINSMRGEKVGLDTFVKWCT